MATDDSSSTPAREPLAPDVDTSPALVQDGAQQDEQDEQDDLDEQAPTMLLSSEEPATVVVPTDAPPADPSTAVPAADPAAAVLTESTAAAVPAAASSPAGPVPGRSGWADLGPDDDMPDRPGIRMRTIVLGLVLLAVSGTSLVRLLTDVHVDDTAVVLTLLIVAGVLLLGGGVASAVREARGSGRARP